MSTYQPCAVAACCTPARTGNLMCLAHWRTTPPTLQMEVNRTWRSFGRCRDRAERGKLLTAYRTARSAAVAHHDRREKANG